MIGAKVGVIGKAGAAGAAGAAGPSGGIYPTSTSAPSYSASGRRWWQNGFINGATLATLGQLHAVPLLLGRSVTIDEISILITSAAAAGGVCRVGLYSNKAGDVYPDALLGGSADLDTTSTGFKSLTGLAVNVPVSGIVWLASSFGVAAPNFRQFTTTLSALLIGYPDNSVIAAQWGIAIARAHSALPNPFPAGATDAVSTAWPAAFFRCSAIT